MKVLHVFFQTLNHDFDGKKSHSLIYSIVAVPKWSINAMFIFEVNQYFVSKT